MLSERMQKTLNSQINAEFHSAYLYLSMAAHLESSHLPGMAHWMEAQAKEEVGHGMRLYKYILERQGKVLLSTIEATPTEWKSPLAVFEEVLRHEQEVTRLINELMAQAINEKDYATQAMLHEFVAEQVEEEATAAQIVQNFKMVGGSTEGALMLDRELAQRK